MIVVIKPGFLHLQEQVLTRIGVVLRRDNFKLLILTREQAETFYQEHRSKPFFEILVNYITSGMVLLVKHLGDQREIDRIRGLMGATDPSKAIKGTLRADFGVNVTQNTVHCSDSIESAKREESFFDSL